MHTTLPSAVVPLPPPRATHGRATGSSLAKGARSDGSTNTSGVQGSSSALALEASRGSASGAGKSGK